MTGVVPRPETANDPSFRAKTMRFAPDGKVVASARDDVGRSRAPWAVAAIVAVTVLAIALLTIDALPVGVVHDDGMYTVLAKALATGRGYRWINLPGAPAATHFPPGYPALLAVVWRIVPDLARAVIAFKVLNALLLAAVAYATFAFASVRLRMPRGLAAIATLVGCAGIPMLVLSTIVMSETLFLALVIPALAFAERQVSAEEPASQDAMLIGLIGGALMLVRTHGIAFLAAVVFALLLRRRVREAALAALAAAVVVAPWQFYQFAHRAELPTIVRGDYGSYARWLADGVASDGGALIVRAAIASSRELFAMLAALTTAALPLVALRWVAVIGAIALLALGVVAVFERARVTALFIAAYLAIVLAWPFTPSRFVWGIWPLIVLLFAAGARSLWSWRPRGALPVGLRAAFAASVALAVVGHAAYTARGYRGRFWSSIPRSTVGVATPTLAWLDAHTPPSAVVATNAEFLVYLYTGRLAVPATTFAARDYLALPSAASRSAALRSILHAYRIDAVAIVANDSLEQAARSMAAAPSPTLVLRDSVPGGLLFTPIVR